MILSFRIRTALFAALALGVPGMLPVHSQQAPGGPDTPRFREEFRMFGLAPGQQIRLTLVHTQPPPDPDRPATNGAALHQSPPDPCRFGLFVFDAAGHEVGQKQGILKAGESAALELAFDELIKGGIAAPDQTGRLSLWAGVTFHHIVGPDRASPPDPCIPTLEILDAATGKVVVLCPPGPPVKVLAPPGPPVRQLFGLVGLVRGQTARLNVLQCPPGPPDVPLPANGAAPAVTVEQPPGPPIDVELSFVDASGNVLLRQEFKVGLGRGVSLDLPAELLLQNGGSQVRGIVRVAPPGPPIEPPGPPIFPPVPCRSSLEIFDNVTGGTSVFQLPAVQVQGAR